MTQRASSERGLLDGELLDGKYRIERQLGQGGMGAVYRGTHLGTKRTVAVKIIRPRYSASREFVERFRREAEAAGRLRHPNVVDVTDFGFARSGSGQVAYLVMEYLDGCTLAEVLAEEGRLPIAWVVDILEQTCSAVDEAHRLGIIHRDLKPENIWLEPNRRGGYTIKVLDFGLAKLAPSTSIEPGAPASAASAADADDTEAPTLMMDREAEVDADADEGDTLLKPVEEADSNESSVATLFSKAKDSFESATVEELTRVGSVMGTPLYMSPEQCLGQSPDPRSDIYSLGVIAYRMLAGETPFKGNSEELKRLHCTGEPVPVGEKNRKVPAKMARVVMSALAKDPAGRPQSAAGFGSAIRASAEGSGVLLRHAAALYSEHFPTFLKASLLAYIPLMVFLLLFYFMDRIVPVEWLGGYLVGPMIFLMLIAASIFAYFAGSAITIPIVVQLMVAPLRPVSVMTALAAIRRRWWMLVVTSLAVVVMALVGTALFVVPGIVVAIYHVLYAPVVVMEQLGVWATLRRARALVKRSWGTVLIITVLQFALPVLVWIASVDTSFDLTLADDYSPKSFSFHFNMSANSSLFQLLNVFVTPLTAIEIALLYLKVRQAGGESLDDALAQFDALEIRRSKWQTRMRESTESRTRSRIGSQ